ncbi:HNH endonuclease signature motif containing protein, partial [Georgenia ruanii]|uniref:HNH endonuclease signature motif containing protein n=1 Tax=Georgenia ruanii TaxID=348442 RepID=UPI0031DE281D
APAGTGADTGAAGAGAAAGGPPAPFDRPPLAQAPELTGYGPISPDLARILAAGGTWRRLVTDPLSGAVLDVGRTRYRPPADLARWVRERDRSCASPGCPTPAWQCQIDHTNPWSQGGTTSADNLGPLCTGDHLLKTAGLFKVRQPTPGVFEWRTPSGHAYRRDITGTTIPIPPDTFDPPTY